MEHYIDKYCPSLTTIIITIVSIILGIYTHYNVPRYTDFECLLVIICTFMLIKGIIMFIKLWAKEL